MPLLPDPAALLAVADRIDRQAPAIRQHAHVLAWSLAHSTWHGSAARTFAAVAHEVCLALRRSAGGLEAAAGALRRHAAHVRAVIADLARAAVDAVQVGGAGVRVGSVAVHAGSSAVHTGGAVVRAATGTAGHVLDAVGI